MVFFFSVKSGTRSRGGDLPGNGRRLLCDEGEEDGGAVTTTLDRRRSRLKDDLSVKTPQRRGLLAPAFLLHSDQCSRHRQGIRLVAGSTSEAMCS